MQEQIALNASTSGRHFIKMHGLLNHFVIVDARSETYLPDVAEIVRICDPRRGVGADQLLVIESPRSTGKEHGADAFMRILNVDGREVEACGNATRCVAWLLMEEAGSDTVRLETLAGIIDCKKGEDRQVSCTMGKVTMDWQKIPLAKQCDTQHVSLPFAPLSDGVALNIGNPHIVFFVADLDAVDVKGIAPNVQNYSLFPEQVNVGVAQLLSETEMRLVVYERGAGLTTACGSGACVAVYAARARGLTDARRMSVSMPAGDMQIEIAENDNAIMTGPVEYCFSGRLR